MAVIVTLFLLALISFWVLGYSHMRFQNQVRLETRRFIAALEEDIRSLQTENSQ